MPSNWRIRHREQDQLPTIIILRTKLENHPYLKIMLRGTLFMDILGPKVQTTWVTAEEEGLVRMTTMRLTKYTTMFVDLLHFLNLPKAGNTSLTLCKRRRKSQYTKN